MFLLKFSQDWHNLILLYLTWKQLNFVINLLQLITNTSQLVIKKTIVGVIILERSNKTNKNTVSLSHSNCKLVAKLKAAICRAVHIVHSYTMWWHCARRHNRCRITHNTQYFTRDTQALGFRILSYNLAHTMWYT